MEPLDVGRIAYQIDVANALIAIQLLGPVTPAQMEDFMLRIEDTPEYDLDQDGLIDLRDYNGQLEVEDLRRIAQFVRERPGNPGARRAIIVKDDLQFGLMRMMESLTSLAPVIYRAFRTEIAARNWLDERKNVLRTTASPALEA